MLRALGSSEDSFGQKLFRAVFLVGYYASLRVGEYAVSGVDKHTLRLEDVVFLEEDGLQSFMLVLNSSKCSNLPAKLVVPAGAEGELCAVSALKEYLVERGNMEGLLFKLKSGAPLRARDVNLALRRAAAAAGLDPKGFSGHSLRAGRTTDLVEMGLADTVIRQSGRWKSDAFLQYVRFDVFRLPGGAPS